MDIYGALKKDHDQLKPLLNELVERCENQQDIKPLLTQIEDELIPHSRAEEAVFYNSLRDINALKDQVHDGYKEHAEAEILLRTLKTMERVNAEGPKLARKLRDALEHHIREEENDIFPLAKAVLLEDEAQQMAQAFERLKPEVREESTLQNTINMVANMMPGRFGDSLKSYSHK